MNQAIARNVIMTNVIIDHHVTGTAEMTENIVIIKYAQQKKLAAEHLSRCSNGTKKKRNEKKTHTHTHLH